MVEVALVLGGRLGLLPRLIWLLGLLVCTASDQKGAGWTHSNKLEVGGARAKVDGERFVTHNNSVVTAQVGASVILHCKTSSATGGLVSWVRKRDYQLLTVGLNSHSSDDRFSINYVHWDWQLHIRYVQPRDAGLYECQVSSHPPDSLFVHLEVVEAEAEILGSPEKHVKLGSILRLVCIMHHTTEALSYVFWYRGNEMINYESEEGTGSVVVESDEHTSVLMVTSAMRVHSGNYTCAPSNTKPASILVHVLNGEYPAAMQHGESSSQTLHPPSILLLLALTLLAALAHSGSSRSGRTVPPSTVMHRGYYQQAPLRSKLTEKMQSELTKEMQSQLAKEEMKSQLTDGTKALLGDEGKALLGYKGKALLGDEGKALLGYKGKALIRDDDDPKETMKEIRRNEDYDSWQAGSLSKSGVGLCGSSVVCHFKANIYSDRDTEVGKNIPAPEVNSLRIITRFSSVLWLLLDDFRQLRKNL